MPTPSVSPVAPTLTAVAPVAPAQPAAPNGAFSKALDDAAHQQSLKQSQKQDTAEADRSDMASHTDANDNSVAMDGSHEFDSVPTETAANALAPRDEDPRTPHASDTPLTLLTLEDSELPEPVDPDATIAATGAEAATAKVDLDSVAHLPPQGRPLAIGTGQDSTAHASLSTSAAQSGPSASSVRAGSPSSRAELLSSLMTAAKRDVATNKPLPGQPDPIDPRFDGPDLSRLLKPGTVTPFAVRMQQGAEATSMVATEAARASDLSTLDADVLPILAAGTKSEVSTSSIFTPVSTAFPGTIQSTVGPGTASAVSPVPTYEASIRAPLESPGFGAALGAQLSVMARDGVQAARLHLNPAEMGPVTVQISLTGHAARVDLVAEQAFTRQMLEQSLPALASALRESGMTLTGGGVFEQHRPPQQPGDEARNGRSQPQGTTTAGSGNVELPGGSVSQRHFSAARGVVDLYA